MTPDMFWEKTPVGNILRSSAFYPHPNAFGSFMASTAIVILYFILSPFYNRRKRLLYIWMFIIIFIAALLSFSRSGWLGMVIALSFLPYLRYPSKWRLYTFILIVFLSLGMLTGLFPYIYSTLSEKLNPGAVEARFVGYGYAWEAFKDSPLTGIGIYSFDTYPGNLLAGSAHSAPLQLLSEIGLFGFIFWYAISFLLIIRLILKLVKTGDPHMRTLLGAVTLGFLTYFVHVHFDVLAFSSLLWLFVAWGESAIRLAEPKIRAKI